MPSRDTIIVVKDMVLGYQTRIRVCGVYVDQALSSELHPVTNQPTDGVQKARAHICQQARSALKKQGRPNRWLSWCDIEHSVRISERITPHTPTNQGRAGSPQLSGFVDTVQLPLFDGGANGQLTLF